MTNRKLLQRLIELEGDVKYQIPAANDQEEFRYISGKIPVLLSAPHGAVHIRNEKPKEEDEYTAGFARLIGELTGARVLYARRKSVTDPNFDDSAPYKSKLKEIVEAENIAFVVDIHGIRANLGFGIALGTINWESCPKQKTLIIESLTQSGFSENSESPLVKMVINHPKYSGGTNQQTVTRYCMVKVKVPAIQIELDATLRIPVRRADASQKDRDFRGDPIHIVKAIHAVQNLVLNIAQNDI